MIIIPREEPVVQNLNSYFLKIDKLVEHYQGEVGTGSVYFKSPTSEGAIFFDEANLVNSYYHDKKGKILGQSALNKIIETCSINNFSVSIYSLAPQRLYFWANLANAEVLYSDLSSEFTDLEGLIVKLESEKLNGYVDVKLNQDAGGGILFLFNGEVIGGASARGDGSLDRSAGYRNDLIAKIRKYDGVFNVKKIDLNITPLTTPFVRHETRPGPKPAVESVTNPARRPANNTAKTQTLKKVKPSPAGPKRDVQKAMEMLGALLSLLERVIQSNRKLKVDFETVLNKKFVEKANKYDFLDPFFDEFRYSNGRVEYTGKASTDEVVKAIVECVREIVQGLGVLNTFSKYFESWKKGFANEIIDFDIEI